MTDRPLTKDQSSWLDALIDHHGRWNTGSGYNWENRSTSIRLTQALVKKGYALRLSDTQYVLNDEHPVVIERRAKKAAWKAASRAASDKEQAEFKARLDRERAEKQANSILALRHQAEWQRLVHVFSLVWEVDGDETAQDAGDLALPLKVRLDSGHWAEVRQAGDNAWYWFVWPFDGAVLAIGSGSENNRDDAQAAALAALATVV